MHSDSRSALLKSTIKPQTSVHPFAAFGNENGQFFIHKLRFADRAPHASAGGSMPIPAHFFAGVAAPALHECAFGKNAPVDFRKVGFVQPRFGGAVNHVAIIEHEARPIGMAEIFEGSNLQRSARLTVIKIIDHVSALVEVNNQEQQPATVARQSAVSGRPRLRKQAAIFPEDEPAVKLATGEAALLTCSTKAQTTLQKIAHAPKIVRYGNGGQLHRPTRA